MSSQHPLELLLAPRPVVGEGSPSVNLSWATVVSTSPLRIRRDGESIPLLGTPDTIFPAEDLEIDDRVYFSVVDGKIVIHGVAGGKSTSIPYATETVQGVVERATQAEVSAGTDTTRYVSPKTLRDRSYAPFAEAAGTVANQTVAAGANVTVTVTFPAGRFSAVPIVVPGILGSTRDVGVSAANVTTTGFQLVFGSNSTVSRTYGGQWHAKQMTSGSGAG